MEDSPKGQPFPCMNPDAIDLLIQKNPRLRRFRAQFEAMQPGAYCVHRNWGLGQIQSYDERANRVIIDWEEGKTGHAMDPAFCVEKLEILGEDDILSRSKSNPAEVEELVKKRQTDLIVELLGKAKEQQMTALEIEAVLIRLLGAPKAKKWWTATKKLLVKDPRVAVPAKKSEPFILREEPVKPEDEILESFFETRAPLKKIQLASKLLDLSVQHEDIEKALPDILNTLTENLQATRQLTLGQRLQGIWVRNDLARFLHDDPEQLEPTSASLIQGAPDLSALAEDIPASTFARYLDLIRRTLTEDWKRAVYDILKNSSGKMTSEAVNFLMTNDSPEAINETFHRWLGEQNLKAPVLVWILKNRNSRKFKKLFTDLVGPRLLSAIFFAIDNEALQVSGTRRIPLAELLSDDRELIPDLLADANGETAFDLAQTLILNQGFEDLSKRALLARFIHLFPQVQTLVGGEAPKSSVDDTLIVSADSLERHKDEYEDIVQKKIPKNKEDIAEARAHGDLRENSEYKMARQEQDILLARKSELEVMLRKARVTDFSEAPTDVIGIGSVVDVRSQSTKETTTFSILGAWDGDPDNNILSYQTPLAKALTGEKPGSEVVVALGDHEETWEILGLRRWVDSKN